MRSGLALSVRLIFEDRTSDLIRMSHGFELRDKTVLNCRKWAPNMLWRRSD